MLVVQEISLCHDRNVGKLAELSTFFALAIHIVQIISVQQGDKSVIKAFSASKSLLMREK